MMLKTLFGDLGPRAVGSSAYAPTEVAFASTAVLEDAVPSVLPREQDPNVNADRDAAWDNESLRADRKVDAACEPSPEN